MQGPQATPSTTQETPQTLPPWAQHTNHSYAGLSALACILMLMRQHKKQKNDRAIH